MAINYKLVGWDTTKYVNPSNMNQMDSGIKSACDGVDSLGNSLTNNVTRIDGKITTIEGNITDINGDIEELNEDLASLTTDTDITKTSTEVTEIDNATDGYIVDMVIRGKCSQNTTSGKNLLNCSGLTTQTLNGVTFTPVYDGNGSLEYIKANGTASATTIYNLNLTITLPNGNYKYCGCPNGGSNSTFKIDTNNGTPFTDYGSGVQIEVSGTNNFSDFRLVVYNGVVCNNLIFKPMITTDTSATYNDYEPYTNGASPNPSYPQEVEEFEGDVETHNRNLLTPTLQTTTLNGVTCERLSDGTYRLNGTASGGNANFALVSNLAISGTYRITGCPIGGSTRSYTIATNVDGKWVASNYDIGDSATINVENNLGMTISIINGTSVSNLIFKPMISEDLSVTYNDYVPSASTLAQLGINLRGIKVASGGNYTDKSGQMWICDKVNLKDGVIERKVKKSTITSFSNWDTTTDYYGVTYQLTDASGYTSQKSADIIASNYTARNSAWGMSGEGCAILSNKLYVVGSKSKYDSVDAFKEAISGMELYYISDNQTTEPLTSSQISALRNLMTYSDKTYFDYDNAFVDVEYFVDTKAGNGVASQNKALMDEINALKSMIASLQSAE